MPDVLIDFLPGPHYPKDMEARIAVLEHIAKITAASLERLEQRQEQMLERMDRRFDAMDRRWVMLSQHHRQDFQWLIAIQVVTVGGLLTALVRGFHWL